jgi:hypothetical protein
MASIWVESIGRSFAQALDLLAAAVGDCPAALWEASMWQVPAPDAGHQFLGPDWKPITDPHTVAPWPSAGWSGGRHRGAWRGMHSKSSTTT